MLWLALIPLVLLLAYLGLVAHFFWAMSRNYERVHPVIPWSSESNKP